MKLPKNPFILYEIEMKLTNYDQDKRRHLKCPDLRCQLVKKNDYGDDGDDDNSPRKYRSSTMKWFSILQF